MPIPNSFAKTVRYLASIALSAIALTACSQQTDKDLSESKPMIDTKPETVYLDVVLFSYIDRPIYDVFANGKWVGNASAFGGGGGLISGVKFPIGPQIVTWKLDGPEGMPGNGETVKASNRPVLSRPDSKTHYLGIHIYPDNTVDYALSQFWPQISAKGDVLYQAWKDRDGE